MGLTLGLLLTPAPQLSLQQLHHPHLLLAHPYLLLVHPPLPLIHPPLPLIL